MESLEENHSLDHIESTKGKKGTQYSRMGPALESTFLSRVQFSSNTLLRQILKMFWMLMGPEAEQYTKGAFIARANFRACICKKGPYLTVLILTERVVSALTSGSSCSKRSYFVPMRIALAVWLIVRSLRYVDLL